MKLKSSIGSETTRSRLIGLLNIVGGIIVLNTLITALGSDGSAEAFAWALTGVAAGGVVGLSLWLLRDEHRLWFVPLLAVLWGGGLMLAMTGSPLWFLPLFILSLPLLAHAGVLLGTLASGSLFLLVAFIVALIEPIQNTAPGVTLVSVMGGAVAGFFSALMLIGTMPPTTARKPVLREHDSHNQSLTPPIRLKPGAYTLGDDGELMPTDFHDKA